MRSPSKSFEHPELDMLQELNGGGELACTNARGCSKLGETAGTEKPFPATLPPIGTSGQVPRHVFTCCGYNGTILFAAFSINPRILESHFKS